MKILPVEWLFFTFVKIEDGIEGLIHNSELDWTNRNIKPSKVFSVSQKIKFKIVSLTEAENLYKIYTMETKNIINKIR